MKTMLSTSQKPCVLKLVLSLYWQASLANSTAPCGAFTVCEQKQTLQLSSSGYHEERKKKAPEQCMLVFSKHWHLRFLFFSLSAWQSRCTCTPFSYLCPNEQVMSLTITLRDRLLYPHLSWNARTGPDSNLSTICPDWAFSL